MVCDAVGMAAGVGLVWARRDGVGVLLSVAAVISSAVSVLT